MNKRIAAFILTAVLCTSGTAGCGRVSTASDTAPNNAPTTVEGTNENTSSSAESTTASPTENTTEKTTEAEGGSFGITLSYYDAEVTVGETKKYPLVTEEINEVWTSNNTSVATVDTAGNITGKGEGKCIITVANADDPTQFANVMVTVMKSTGGYTADPGSSTGSEGAQSSVVSNEGGGNASNAGGNDNEGNSSGGSSQPSNDGITYMEGILIANKSYALPRDYNPGGLTAETSAAFQSLCSAAAADGLNMWVTSGFRSYETQEWLYNNYAATDGQAAADTYSARPGYSEHQTGLAIDVNDASDNFIGTPQAVWLEQHCYEYGFIIRYPKGKQSVTGYKYEPWHIRYVGKDFADKFRTTAEYLGDPYYTLEEYFGIDSYYH